MKEGGLCVNPEAAEIFYLTRAEKRRVLEISMEEAHGKMPIIAGTWALTTEETVATARDVKALGADALSVSAHKVAGPVGVGALVIARTATLVPLIHGGNQQRARSGTQDAAGAVAFGVAATAAAVGITR